MGVYKIGWHMVYEADSPEDAVRQALGDLAVVASDTPRGPTAFEVYDDDDGFVAMIDVEFDDPRLTDLD